MKPVVLTKLTTVASVILVGILILMPFHALLTVAGSSLTGNYDLWRIWKEILLLLLAPVVLLALWKDRSLWKRLQGDWLFWAIVCYVLLHIGLGLLALQKGQVNSYALIAAWILNLRLVAIFAIAWILAMVNPWLQRYWKKLLLWPAALVIAFGLLQIAVLPYDFLKHAGYGPATIEPYGTVDEKFDYIRIQSTLRGANPLGAYLVLVMSALLVLLRRSGKRVNALLVVGLAASAIVMINSYSRSAYIGLVIAGLASVILAVRNRKERQLLAIGLVFLALLSAGLFAAFRTNDQLENTLYHTNEDSQSSISSNEQRADALRDGVQDVIAKPFGLGPGTAGPASIHNSQPGRIAENYYLQIGQETGWLGLGLFIAIVLTIGKRLWQRRSNLLARTLLVSLAGISFINLIQHAWTDDTLALVWWGLAGIAISSSLQPAILKHKKQSYEKAKPKDQGSKTSTATPST
jgi:hypothetical protein